MYSYNRFWLSFVILLKQQLIYLTEDTYFKQLNSTVQVILDKKIFRSKKSLSEEQNNKLPSVRMKILRIFLWKTMPTPILTYHRLGSLFTGFESWKVCSINYCKKIPAPDVVHYTEMTYRWISCSWNLLSWSIEKLRWKNSTPLQIPHMAANISSGEGCAHNGFIKSTLWSVHPL